MQTATTAAAAAAPTRLVSVALLAFVGSLLQPSFAPCPNSCSGHGTCTTATNTCVCNVGWGASSDISYYRAPDCSKRVCPSGKAWGDVPTAATTAHAEAECSNAGICDRGTGTCKCFAGYDGDACHRSACPNNCSGHGTCMNMKQAADAIRAQPLSKFTVSYGGYDLTTTWDEEAVYGCVCDSSWAVGMDSGETQEPEYFGADCSLRHCPSGDDPLTQTVDETDCNGLGGVYTRAVARGGSTTTMTLHNAAEATQSFYTGMIVRLDSGTGVGQLTKVSGYDGSTRVATLSPTLATAPDATTSFTVFEQGGLYETGTATSGDATVLALANTASGVDNFYNDMVLSFDSGTGAGQVFSITAYAQSSKEATLGTTPAVNGGSDTVYKIYGGTTGNLCHVDCSNRGKCKHDTGECVCYSGFYKVNCGAVLDFQ